MTGGKRGGHDIFTLSAPQIRLQSPADLTLHFGKRLRGEFLSLTRPQLPGELDMAEVGGGMFDHMEDSPAHRHLPVSEFSLLIKQGWG